MLLGHFAARQAFFIRKSLKGIGENSIVHTR
jgi:hypothetical protein